MSPKKTYRKKAPVKDSFRIKIGGSGNQWSIQDLRAMLNEAVDHMEAAGIPCIKGGYLYYSPLDHKGNPITRAHGRDLEDMLIPAPYRSAAEDHGL